MHNIIRATTGFFVNVATGIWRHIPNHHTSPACRTYMVQGEAQQAWAWFGAEGCTECYEV